MNLGFIGLGNLGLAVAGRLLERGHQLTVWNRTPAKSAGLEVRVAAAPAEVAAEIVFLCLFDSRAVAEVLNGPQGLLQGKVGGRIVVDLTTNHFREVLPFHRQCREAGVSYLESPVLGSVVPAAKGALTILTSGERDAYDRVRPLLADLGQHLFFLEQPGLASRMKLINNLTLGSFMATLAEALALGEAAGLGREAVLEILGVGGGSSLVLNAKKQKLLSEDFAPHFSSALIYKDLHCLQDLAYECRQPLFTGALVKELYAKTFAAGIEEQDFSAIYRLFKKD